MNLDAGQREKVAAWIGEGLKLSEIQTRMETELGLRMTYLDVRLLVDELKLMPKDAVVPEPPKEPAAPPKEETPAAGKVSVTVDKMTQPGTLVSGTVTFSDGKTASWFLDETGRLGLAAKEKGYKPSQEDVQIFQVELQKELQRLGM